MPDGVFKENLSRENALGTDSCIAIELAIELDAYEDKKITLILGEEENKSICESISDKYRNVDKALDAYRRTKDYWSHFLRKVQVKTEDEEMNFLLNGWAMYQVVVSRLYAKSRILPIRWSIWF